MTGVHQDKGRAIGFVASLAVHLLFAIALWSGALTPPIEPREVHHAAEGIAAASPDSSEVTPTRAQGPPARGTLVPQSPEPPGQPSSASGGRGSGALEYASIPREGFVDGPRPGRSRWEILQPIVHVANTVESRRVALLDHLWQSTAFAMIAALLTLAFRRNRASVRYWLWFAASVKFLVPFSILTAIGSRLPGAPTAQVMAERALAAVQLSEPLQRWPSSAWLAAPTPAISIGQWVVLALVGVWACGFVLIGAVRVRMWQRIRAALRASTPLRLPDITVPAGIELRSSAGLLEPGVVGWRWPVLLMPAGIEQHLSPAQLETVVAHEVCHVHRQDNLTAAIHMLVEAIFWFHPFAWWIGSRLLDERERACDEAVLRTGHAPTLYAEAILNVCKRYVESPLVCVAGVSGSSIVKRIDAILKNEGGRPVPVWKRGLLAIAAASACALPIGIGLMNAPLLRAHMEVRRVAVLALVRANSDGLLGPKLIPTSRVDCGPPASAPASCALESTPGTISGRGVTLVQLADLLARELKRPVVERTTLSGRFDLELTFAADGNAASLAAALRDQLGLILEPATAPLEITVIESVAPPPRR